ncbi:MAG: pyrroline-5-carboxylate reductase [Chlamydiales bacterium]
MSIRIIGCGAMGSAIAQALAKSGTQVSVYDLNHTRAKTVSETIESPLPKAPLEGVTSDDHILLAVKPKDLEATANQLKEFNGQLVISILTGVSTEEIKAVFPKCQVLRMMPNLAVRYRKGTIALAQNPDLPSLLKQEIEKLFSPLGSLHWIDEEHFDAITALTGSGPAFVCTILESMIDSAIAMGLPFDISYDLIKEMIGGTLKTLQESNKLPGELKWQCASPKGTTIYGLRTFEEKGVRSGVIETFLSAYKRAQEL